MSDQTSGQDRRSTRLISHTDVERSHPANQQPRIKSAQRIAKLVTHFADSRPKRPIADGGERASKGMVSFKNVLAEGQAEAIYHYVVSQANKAKAEQAAKR